MNLEQEITKLVGVLDTLLVKENKTEEDLDRIEDLKLTISELSQSLDEGM